MGRFSIKQLSVGVSLLALAGVLVCYVPLFNAPFLHDDIRHLGDNPDLHAVQTVSDAFSFSIQPTRVFPNLAAAFIQLGFGTSTVAHRFVSLLLHLAVCFLLFSNLILFARKTDPTTDWTLPALLATVCFALHPVCSEVVFFSTYRWELLGTFFTLSAMRCLQSELDLGNGEGRARLVGACLLVVAATFSKETYGLFSPVACLATYRTSTKKILPLLFSLSLVAILSVVGIWALMSLPTRFPYSGYVGPGTLRSADHLELAALAFTDFFKKLLLVGPITFIRLASRLKYDLNWSEALSASVLTVGILGFSLVFYFGKSVRVWLAITFVMLAFYLGLPNIDMGAPHYYYFAVASVSASTLPVWAFSKKLKTIRARPLGGFLAVVVLGTLCLSLYSRTQELSSKHRVRVAELETLGNLPVTWAWVAYDMAHDTAVSSGELNQFLLEATRRFPGDIELQMVTGDIAAMGRLQ